MKAILSSLCHSPAPVAAFAIVGAFWGTFAAYVPEIKAGIGASDAAFGAALLFSGLGLCTSLFVAPIADRMLGPRAMQVGAGVLALAFLLPASVPNVWTFALAMFCAAAASGLLDVVMNSRVSELESRTKRSLMNSHHAIFSVGYAITALLSGPAREFGVPAVMAFAVVALCTVAALSWLKMETEIASDEADTGALRMGPVVFWGGLITLIAFMSEGATENWSALHIERTLGGRAAEGAFGPFMLGLTMAIGRFSGQAVVDKLSETRVIVGGLRPICHRGRYSCTRPGSPDRLRRLRHLRIGSFRHRPNGTGAGWPESSGAGPDSGNLANSRDWICGFRHRPADAWVGGRACLTAPFVPADCSDPIVLHLLGRPAGECWARLNRPMRGL